MNPVVIGLFFFSLSLVGCNSIIITHTQGRADDVVDSQPQVTAEVNPNISPTVSVPKGI